MASIPQASQEPSPRQTYRLMAGMAIAIILLLAGAIYSLSRTETAPWTSDALPLPEMTTAASRPMPAFDGGKLTPALFTGRWTLLSFWSITCPPCLDEMPALNQLSQSWDGPEMQIFMVNVDARHAEDFEAAKRYYAEQQFLMSNFDDTNGSIAKAFAVDAYPRHFLIDAQGHVVWEALGAFRWNDPKAKDALLKLMEQVVPDSSAPTSTESAPDPAE